MPGAALAPLVAIITLVACNGQGCESGDKKAASEAATGRSSDGTAAGRPPEPSPEPAAAAAAPAPATRPPCVVEPFTSDHVPREASGAVVLASGDVLVVSDSGHQGAFAILARDGSLQARGALPLGEGASDDLEGLARRGEEIYGITSSGWIRRWERDGGAFTLTAGPYPIDATGAATCASGTSFNCGPNYEGLCLRPAEVTGPCDGFAVANAEAALRCLVFDPTGQLQLAAEPVLRVGFPGQLSGCSIAPSGELWVVANRLGGNALGLVEGWSAPEAATLRLMGGSPAGFIEAVAAGPDDRLFAFSDQDQSLRNHRNYHCPR